MHTREEKVAAFGRLLDILDELRVKCPWDRKQTFESLRPNTIEETFELADALLQRNKKEICKELGDVLLHVIFYAKIGSETQDFDIYDVCENLSNKLVYRHPHVFGTIEVDTADEVSKNWEELKKNEKKYDKVSDSLRKVPPSLPSILKAQKIIAKAESKLGYSVEMSTISGVSIPEKIFLLCAEANQIGLDLEKGLNLVTDKFISCVEDTEGTLKYS